MKVNCCNKIVLNLKELSVLLRHVTHFGGSGGILPTGVNELGSAVMHKQWHMLLSQSLNSFVL